MVIHCYTNSVHPNPILSTPQLHPQYIVLKQFQLINKSSKSMNSDNMNNDNMIQIDWTQSVFSAM